MIFPSKAPKPEDPPERPPLDDAELIAHDPVLRWRFEQFNRVGMTVYQARRCALDKGVDLHFVLHGLIARGCDPSVAFDIVT